MKPFRVVNKRGRTVARPRTLEIARVVARACAASLGQAHWIYPPDGGVPVAVHP